jgi:hypothetical protein
MLGSSPDQNIGKLIVSPKEAVLFRSTEFFVDMSPYVIVNCGLVS